MGAGPWGELRLPASSHSAQRDGWTVNHKRVYRLCGHDGLLLRRENPKGYVSCQMRMEPPVSFLGSVMKVPSKIQANIYHLLTPFLAFRLKIGLLVLLRGWLAIGVVSLIICAYSFNVTESVTGFPRDRVSSIAGTLIVFLGVTTAILIAVFTTAHVQARTKQSSGYAAFLASVGSFKTVVLEMETILGQITSHLTWKAVVQWKDAKGKLVSTLDEITPLWQGYDSGIKVEQHSVQYVWASEVPLTLIAEQRNQQWSNELRIRHEQSMRNLTIGLRVLDEAAVDRRFAESLVKILASLSVLLICCILVRMVSGVGYGQVGAVSNWVNLFIYLYLPSLAIGNFLALLYVVLGWWRRLRRSDEWWNS